MSEFGHGYASGAGVRIDTWGAGPFVIKVGDKSYRFEDSDRFGPALINKRGDPLANPWPSERSPFWAAHSAWRKQGRRLEDDGITCVHDPLKPTLVCEVKIRGKRGRQLLVIEFGDDDGETIVVPPA